MGKSLVEALEATGVARVLVEIAEGKHGVKGSLLRNEVDAWLVAKQSLAAAEASGKRDAREEETLSLAKEANRLAKEANRFASEANRFASEANRLASEANSIARSQAAAAWRAARYSMYAAVVATIVALVASKDEIFKILFP